MVTIQELKERIELLELSKSSKGLTEFGRTKLNLLREFLNDKEDTLKIIDKVFCKQICGENCHNSDGLHRCDNYLKKALIKELSEGGK